MMVWSKRGNINVAALVTIVQCNTLVVLCSMQLIGPALPAVHIVTKWSGCGGIEAYLSGQLSALTLLVGTFVCENGPRNDL